MKNFMKKFKKHWIKAWLIIAAVSLCVVTSYAIYTRVTVAKRVVSTDAGTEDLFSSDYMSQKGITTTVSQTDNTQNAEVSVHVYNYAYPKESVYKNTETQYDVTATIGTIGSDDIFTELSDTSGLTNRTYSVTYAKNSETFLFNATNGTQHKFDGCTITGDRAYGDLFTLVFDKSELGEAPPNYCIKLEAEPYDSDLPKLTGYIKVRFAKSASNGWRGEVEKLDDSKDYDGFNYYLEGNGAGMLTFRWNKSKVTINKQFLNNKDNEFYNKTGDVYTKYTQPLKESDLATDPNDNDIVYLTIKVDSTITNRYEVQFYKVDPSTISYTKTDVEGYLPSTSSNDWVPDQT